jgi:hypothetical protein
MMVLIIKKFEKKTDLRLYVKLIMNIVRNNIKYRSINQFLQ